jgi:hypothetical protein
MEIKFCPGCSAIMEQLPRTQGGISELYWVCPEGDWEEPVNRAKQSGVEAEATADK